MRKFKHCEAIVFEPKWWIVGGEYEGKHPLKYREVVYFVGEIPNVEGHCLVATYDGRVVPMVHPTDFRRAKEEEL